MMANSLRNVNVSKNRVIAVNIAREGIEAVRNIRDTNWLKFSGNRRICWNSLPDEDINEPCDGTDLIDYEADGYIVYKASDHRWRLQDVTAADETALSTVDIDLTVNTDGDNDPNGDENDSDMYNHTDPADALGRDYAQNTNFYRVITIEYLDEDGNYTNNPYDNRIEVSSTVTWIKGSAEHSVELKTHLTDYLGRDNLD
ncbi:hypothetical protein KJ742_07795 [Patescibacteria group bacterium]|nr:hypothetical protein [Patescibacteria group bacterium]MBU1683814.1 hypothetical protein [Patescibacteria group bacterium]MBU1935132.1 hypothetical protein [Patescibacteria group bacterium]